MEDIIINVLENLKAHNEAYKVTSFDFEVDGKEVNINFDVEKI